MWRRFNGFVEKERLFAGCGKLLLAVSGGVDSVVLLHLMVRYVKESASLTLGIVHCNFHLRGNESDRDEAFVRRLASSYGIPLFVSSFDTGSHALRHGISIEMAARELRYGYFSELMRAEGFDACLLAHHADDNTETFFINLFRGSGVKGLRGMLPCSGRETVYLRPLLFARRAEIVAYAEQEGLEHVEDSTNAEPIYLRNKIRHSVLPVLEECSPGFSDKLNQSMHTLRAVDALVEDWYAAALKRTVRVENIDEEKGIWQEFLPVKAVARLQPHKVLFWELYLRERGFSRQQIGQIVENEEKGISGKTFFNTGGTGFLLREPEGWRWMARKISGAGMADREPACGQECQMISCRQDISPDSDTVYLDYEKLQFPLYWRHWRPGDRFRPLGMKGFRKLSDFFGDLRIGRREKDRIWLLCSGQDIVWVAGYRMDDRYKIDLSSLPQKAWVVKLKQA